MGLKTFKTLRIFGREVKELSINGVRVKIGEDKEQPFTITALDDSVVVSLTKIGEGRRKFANVSLEYSLTDGESWEEDLLVPGNDIELQNGETIQLRRPEDSLENIFYMSDDDCIQFTIGGRFKIDGDLNSLIVYENYRGINLAEVVSTSGGKHFYGIFKNNRDLVEVGDIFSSDILSTQCYADMFYGCSSLVKVPRRLPAMNLANSCYQSMFSGCSSIEQAPELPATTLYEGCYEAMFSMCASLTQVPSILPATNLADGCYQNMFRGCYSLTQAPELPAMELKKGCYAYMFNGCSSIEQSPELPATTLASNCYYYMFNGCSSIEQSPELPATTLYSSCYSYMFNSCKSLTKAPELPATNLTVSCYRNMFNGCSSLTKAPELPATTLANNCYQNMFNGCSNLNEVKVGFTSWGTQTNNWLNGVASIGTFTAPAELIETTSTRGVNTVPVGWNMVSSEGTVHEWLRFTAQEANSTVKLQKNGSAPDVNLQYSFDGYTWTPYVIGNALTLANVGDKVYMKAVGSNERMGTSTSNYNQFVMTGKIAASGNLNSLLEEDEETARNLSLEGKDYCFYRLFYYCTSLAQAPELPATTLATYCYSYMFYKGYSLTQAPELPAMNLADGCYQAMFNDSYLTKAPELPATTLAKKCYNSMFENCSKLTQAPRLPTTQLVNDCYHTMFKDCTSLIQAPELPATTLASGCYSFMFYGCTRLNNVNVKFTSWGSQTNTWLLNVASTGTFRCPQSLIDATTTRGISTVPTNWTMVSND